MPNPQEVREKIRALGNGIMGTFLIAPEGVNGMFTGTEAHAQPLKKFLCSLGVENFKEVAVDRHYFERFLVKVKKEIISVGATVNPAQEGAPRIPPSTLKKWIEEKKPITLLDARNAYEVKVGTFQGAADLNLDSSREFAHKAKAWLSQNKQPIVTFCTGGIRCEKAAMVLQKLGAEEVYQLDGGILRYFEQYGAEYFEGDCFVFDWRLAVDGKLEPKARSEQANESFGRHRLP